MEKKYYSLVSKPIEVDAILDYCQNQLVGITPIFIPFTLEGYLYLKENNSAVDLVSKYFDNDGHKKAITFIEKIRHNAAGDIKSDAVWKEYRHYLSFNVSYIIFVLEVLKDLCNNNDVVLISSGMYKITDYVLFKDDLIVSDIVQEFSKVYGIENIVISSSKELPKLVDAEEYSIINLSGYAGRVFVPYLGYNIKNILKLLKRKFGCRSFYLKRFSDKNHLKSFFVGVYYLFIYGSKPIYYKVKTKQVPAYLDLVTSKYDFSFNGVDFYSVIQDKLVSSYVYYDNQQKFIDEIEKLYDRVRPFLTISYHSRGISDSLSYLAKSNNCEALCISHGTVSEAYGDYDRIYKKYIAESVIYNNYSTVAIQSPIAESFFNNNTTHSIKIKTGNLIFSSCNIWREMFSRLKKRKTVVYAVTFKDLFNIQFLGAHIYDEFIQEIYALNSVLNKDFDFIVQLHPQLRGLFKKYISSFHGIRLNFGKMNEIINQADVLISLSSTAIEDALNCKVPVILYDGVNRYKHCKSLDLDNNQFHPYPVYYTKNIDVVIKNIFKIVTSKNIDWSSHVYPENYIVNLEEYLESAINTKQVIP